MGYPSITEFGPFMTVANRDFSQNSIKHGKYVDADETAISSVCKGTINYQ